MSIKKSRQTLSQFLILLYLLPLIPSEGFAGPDSGTNLDPGSDTSSATTPPSSTDMDTLNNVVSGLQQLQGMGGNSDGGQADSATHAATSEATHAATSEATHAATSEATHAATSEATHAATSEATHAATSETTHAATSETTHAATSETTHAATSETTHAATSEATAATSEVTHAATSEVTHAATSEAEGAAKKSKKGGSCMVAAFTALSLIQRGMSLRGDVQTRNNSCSQIKALKVQSTHSATPSALGGTGSADSQANNSGNTTPAAVMSSAAQCGGALCSISGITAESIFQSASPGEQIAIAAAGGIGNLINSLPNPAGFATLASSSDPVSAVMSILPSQSGEVGAALGSFATSAASAGVRLPGGGSAASLEDSGSADDGPIDDSGANDSAATADFPSDGTNPQADADPSLNGDPNTNAALANNTGGNNGPSAYGRPQPRNGEKSNDFNFDISSLFPAGFPGLAGNRQPAAQVPTTGIVNFKNGNVLPEVFVFHKGSAINLFDIVSNRIKRVTSRVF